MKIRDRAVEAAARAGFGLLRLLVLRLSDRSLGRLFRLIERLAYAITGDKAIKATAAEVADIFESGPPFTTTVRKLFEGGEADTVASAIKCLSKPSPYGSV